MLNSRKREIRIKAEDFREKCKVGKYGIIDLFGECERCGIKLFRYPLGEHADLGFSTKRDEDIIIFTNSCSRLAREIFTLAHEIGHIQMHFEQGVSFVENNLTLSGCTIDEKEQEANYFAACLLMPINVVERFFDLEISEDRLLSSMDIAKMMSEFNVSFEMALYRLENIGIIDFEERVCLDNEKNKFRVGNLLKSVGGNSRLNIASEEMTIPSEYIEYVIYNYNHNAIPTETLKKLLEYYSLTIEDISDRLVPKTEEDLDLEELIGGLDD